MPAFLPPRRSSTSHYAQSRSVTNPINTSNSALIPQPLKVAKRPGRHAYRTCSGSGASSKLFRTQLHALPSQCQTNGQTAANRTGGCDTRLEHTTSMFSLEDADAISKTSLGLLSPPQSPESPWAKDTRHSSTLSASRVSSLKVRHISTASTDTGYYTAYSQLSPPSSPTLLPRQFPEPAAADAEQLPRPTRSIPPLPSTETSSQPHSHCYICLTPLPSPDSTPMFNSHASQQIPPTSYSFPTTAPAVLQTIYNIYPLSLRAHHLPEPNLPTLTHPPTPSKSTYPPTTATSSTSANPLFCHSCFTAIHALSLCWTCGLPVLRPEERVRCGWAIWHWGCVSCLLCRAPVKPPEWGVGADEGQKGEGNCGAGRQGEISDDDGGGGMVLKEWAACGRCRRRVNEVVGCSDTAKTKIDDKDDRGVKQEDPERKCVRDVMTRQQTFDTQYAGIEPGNRSGVEITSSPYRANNRSSLETFENGEDERTPSKIRGYGIPTVRITKRRGGTGDTDADTVSNAEVHPDMDLVRRMHKRLRSSTSNGGAGTGGSSSSRGSRSKWMDLLPGNMEKGRMGRI